LATLDYAIIIVYLAILVTIGIVRRSVKGDSAAGFILGGRLLTLPAFVATLVSSWYGGILGVGEFSYNYGLSTWLVFGVPYYVAAFIFAFFLAKKARRTEVLTIPDRLDKVYGRRTALAGSVILFVLTIPGAYVLALAGMVYIIFGWPLWLAAVVGTAFSLFYVYLGGFRTLVRTDILQFSLMFIGFGILFITAFSEYGGLGFIKDNVPSAHLSWHGGNTPIYIAVWYIIALQTLIEPSFYQRCYAAKSENVARNGILLSVAFWLVFDFLTTSCGLYARAIVPDLTNAQLSYPALGELILPIGLRGIFVLGLLATVMSTVDSYTFLAASTFSRDIVWRFFGISEERIKYYTQLGLIISGGLAVVIALYFRSIVTIWHDFGSVGTPALLVPLFFAHNGKRTMPPRIAFASIIFSGGLSLIWLILCYLYADPVNGIYLYSIPPILPGLILSILFYLFGAKVVENRV